MKYIFVFLSLSLTACATDKQYSVEGRAALFVFLVTLCFLLYVVPKMTIVVEFKVVSSFFKKNSKLLFKSIFIFGAILTFLGMVLFYTNQGYEEARSVVYIIWGVGLVVGSSYLKKWHKLVSSDVGADLIISQKKQCVNYFFKCMYLSGATSVALIYILDK